jgi:hypothetical protein
MRINTGMLIIIKIRIINLSLIFGNIKYNAGKIQTTHSGLFITISPIKKERKNKLNNVASRLYILNATEKMSSIKENARDSVRRYPLKKCISGIKKIITTSPNKFLFRYFSNSPIKNKADTQNIKVCINPIKKWLYEIILPTIAKKNA